jgi:hypothetical protein
MATPTSSPAVRDVIERGTLSATSTGLRIGSSSTEVLSRIDPVSGASRASIGIGCGQTVGCESQCWPIETQVEAHPRGGRDHLDGLVDDARGGPVRSDSRTA